MLFFAESLPIRSYDCKGFGRPLRHVVFCLAMRALVKRLKGEEQPNDDRINLGWARAAVKKSAARYYGDGSWKVSFSLLFFKICSSTSLTVVFNFFPTIAIQEPCKPRVSKLGLLDITIGVLSRGNILLFFDDCLITCWKGSAGRSASFLN